MRLPIHSWLDGDMIHDNHLQGSSAGQQRTELAMTPQLSYLGKGCPCLRCTACAAHALQAMPEVAACTSMLAVTVGCVYAMA